LFEQVVAGGGEEAALGDGSAPVAGAAYTLHGCGDGTGGVDLADEVNVADVDAELEGCGGDEDLDFAGLEAGFGVETERAGEGAVMGGDVFYADAFGEGEGDFFDEAAGVDEDEGGAVVLGVGGELVEDLFPHTVGGDGAKFVGGDFDGDVEFASLAYLDDGGGLARRVDAGEKAGYELDGVLGGGEADALGRCAEAGEEGSGAEAVFAGDDGVEPLEREGEVGAAFAARDGVDFVDDEGADMAQVFAGFAGGEEEVERFGCGDKDVRRVAQHGGAVFSGGVAGADAGADLRAEIAALEGELLDFVEGAVEVFLDVVGKRFEGTDVDDLGAGGEVARDGFAEELVDAD